METLRYWNPDGVTMTSALDKNGKRYFRIKAADGKIICVFPVKDSKESNAEYNEDEEVEPASSDSSELPNQHLMRLEYGTSQ